MPVTELSIDLSEKRRCFWCQKPGHLKRNCRMGAQGQRSAPPGRGGGNYDYQDKWNAGELSPLVESQISTLTNGGAAAERVNKMSTAVRTANSGQRFPACVRKYQGRQFNSQFSHATCLLDSGNTTSPGVAMSLKLAQKLNVKIVPYNLEVKNVNGGKCPIVGVVAPGELTIAFNTADRASTEFEIRPLVLQAMADDLNIGIAFMRKLKMQFQFGCPVEVWAPQLGRLIDPLAPPLPLVSRVMSRMWWRESLY